MQDPTSEEGNYQRLVARLGVEKIPALKHVIQSYDTAFSKKAVIIITNLHGEYFNQQRVIRLYYFIRCHER